MSADPARHTDDPHGYDDRSDDGHPPEAEPKSQRGRDNSPADRDKGRQGAAERQRNERDRSSGELGISHGYAAQHESISTSVVKLWAVSLMPSAIVR